MTVKELATVMRSDTVYRLYDRYHRLIETGTYEEITCLYTDKEIKSMYVPTDNTINVILKVGMYE